MDHEPDLSIRQKPPQQQNPQPIHSNLEHLQKSVEPSILPAEYGGSVSTKDCIISWKKELEENRATVLELDTMKVEQGPVEREHTPVVRKKSRHDSGSQVSNFILNSLILNTGS